MAIGSDSFIEQVFVAFRDAFGKNRRDGARRLPKGEWDGLCAARDLRVAAVSLPLAGDG